MNVSQTEILFIHKQSIHICHDVLYLQSTTLNIYTYKLCMKSYEKIKLSKIILLWDPYRGLWERNVTITYLLNDKTSVKYYNLLNDKTSVKYYNNVQ
jgi:hypothetical protein